MKLVGRILMLTAALAIAGLTGLPAAPGKALAADAPAWKVDLDDPVGYHEFLESGKYLFFNSGKYSWLYEAANGRQVYALKVDGFQKKGVNALIGNRYLASSGNDLVCYDALTGKVSWKKAYDKIKQAQYNEYRFLANTAVFDFGKMEVAIDLETGDELWRAEMRYNQNLIKMGTFNNRMLEKTGKILIMEPGNKLALFDARTGKKMLAVDKVEANEKLIKENLPWQHVSEDDRYVSTILEKGLLIVDTQENKVLLNVPMEIYAKFDLFLPVPNGITVFGEEKVVNVTYEGAKVTEVAFPIKEVRTLKIYPVDGTDILLISGKNRLAAVNLTDGAKLWQTDIKHDENRAGFIRAGFVHRYISQEGTDAILSYVEAGNYSRTSPGSWVFAMRINLLTGEVKYKTLTGIAKAAISDIGRAAGRAAAAIVQTVKGGAEEFKKSFGYENVGFEYETLDHDGKLIYVFRNKVAMVNPVNDKEPGEGFCAIDPVSGQVAYQDYFELLHNTSWSASSMYVTAPAPLVDNGIAYLAGNGRVVAFDLTAGKRLWTVEKELKKGYPTDIAVIDGVAYLKLGKDPVEAGLDKNKVTVRSPWEHEPHGFAAIDAGNGAFLWKYDLKNDPGVLLPQFTLRNYYNPATKQLYFADEENLYALGLRRDGGKVDWKLGLDKAKLGELQKKNIYAVNTTFLGTKPRTTSTTHGMGGGYTLTTYQTSGGMSSEGKRRFIEDAADADVVNKYTSFGVIWGVTAKRCLRILFDTENILVIGSDGIGLVDASNGKTRWVTEWNYNHQDTDYIPKIHNGKIVFCSKRKMAAVDLATGKKLWEVKEAKEPRFFTAPDETLLISIDKEIIKGYQL